MLNTLFLFWVKIYKYYTKQVSINSKNTYYKKVLLKILHQLFMKMGPKVKKEAPTPPKAEAEAKASRQTKQC